MATMKLASLFVSVLLAQSAPAFAELYVVNCASSRQIGGGLTSCDAKVDIALTADGAIRNYELIVAAPATHCSSVVYQISGPGMANAVTTPNLTPGSSRRVFLTKDLPAGTHTYTIRALGVIGGCNVGAMNSWGVEVTPRIRP